MIKILVADDVVQRLVFFKGKLPVKSEVFTTLDFADRSDVEEESFGIIFNTYKYSFDMIQEHNGGDILFLDHDFVVRPFTSKSAKTGYDLILDFQKGILPFPRLGAVVHSANHVAGRRMVELWKDISDLPVIHAPLCWFNKPLLHEIVTSLQEGGKELNN